VRPYRSVLDVPLPQYGEGEVVAIKLHMGERGNKTYVRPEDVRILVQRLKDAGARPFLTDTTTLYQRKRANVKDYLETAALNGFTEQLIGCPVIIADAEGSERVGRIHVAKGLLRATSLVVLSHATGHISTGFAGALKNLSMGCVSKEGKRYIHGAAWPRYREESCKKCGDCVEACPFGFVVLKDRIELNLKNCPACERCLKACKEGGLWRPEGAMEECYRRYAETCRAVLSRFPRALFINEIRRVTRFCDCSVDAGDVISPDIGFLASEDPVEIDRETVRLIVERNPDAAQAFGERWTEFIESVSRWFQS